MAAAGIVTIPSLLQADDQTPTNAPANAPAPASAPAVSAEPNSVLTPLSSTTLGGYVDTSAQWNFGTGNANNPPYSFGGPTKADGFNLNVVDLALDKPQDDSLWAAGYHVELWMGPDANLLASQSTTATAASDFAIRQAYAVLRTPVGNGIDWKIGVWDTIIGYEGLTAYNNPHYTHSYGFTIEPTTHTGLLGSYKFNDQVSVSAGVADTFGPTINGRAVSPFPPNTPNESFKTYLGSVTLTAPEAWGWLSGSTLSAGVINGFNVDRQTSFYLGTTIATPVQALKLGGALDYLDMHNGEALFAAVGPYDGTIWALAFYANYQASDKLLLNFRGEWVDDNANLLQNVAAHTSATGAPAPASSFRAMALTATAQYDLWKNVLSRVELRWDHAESATLFGGSTVNTPTRRNAYMLAANIIYKF